jgi:hypothetical protein
MKKDKKLIARAQKLTIKMESMKKDNNKMKCMIKDNKIRICEIKDKIKGVIEKVYDKRLLNGVGDKRRHTKRDQVYDIIDRCMKKVGDTISKDKFVDTCEMSGVSMQTVIKHMEGKACFVKVKQRRYVERMK